jgi:hypothetical protein
MGMTWRSALVVGMSLEHLSPGLGYFVHLATTSLNLWLCAEGEDC